MIAEYKLEYGFDVCFKMNLNMGVATTTNVDIHITTTVRPILSTVLFFFPVIIFFSSFRVPLVFSHVPLFVLRILCFSGTPRYPRPFQMSLFFRDHHVLNFQAHPNFSNILSSSNFPAACVAQVRCFCCPFGGVLIVLCCSCCWAPFWKQVGAKLGQVGAK